MSVPTARAVCGLPIAGVAMLWAHPAFAHAAGNMAGGLTSGILHPLTGPDHLVAMVAVGLWGAQLGNPAIWVLPIAFPIVMAFGALLGIAGAALPASELMIALSAVALGGVVATRARAPFWMAAVLVSIFAIFHGYAHGRELPESADAVSYAVGFVTATGLLHLTGIALGTLSRFGWGATAIRGLGGAIAALGCAFLILGGPG